MPDSTTPRSVVLNLVRVSPRQSIEVRQLVEVGRLFGFADNAVRVAVTRLAAQGLLESDERGSYRLGPAATTLGAHVEQWRRGETRMRPWKGDYVAVALPPKPERAARRASLEALARLGLREGLPGLWLRPDNLRQPFEQTLERLGALGLEPAAEAFVATRFGARLDQRLREGLWPTAELERGYARTLRDLERSLSQLPAMPPSQALVQSFLLGGAAIRLLATDPLLPEQIMPGATRAALTEVMLRYDRIGHELWRDVASRPALTLVQGGRDAG